VIYFHCLAQQVLKKEKTSSPSFVEASGEMIGVDQLFLSRGISSMRSAQLTRGEKKNKARRVKINYRTYLNVKD